MRALTIPLLPLLLSLVLFRFAAAGTKGSVYEKYLPIAAKSPTIDLNDASAMEITEDPSRDYYFAVLMTVHDSRFGCTVCTELHPEWDILAGNWKKQYRGENPKVLMGTLDFMNGKQLFIKQQLTTAPSLLVFFPNVGPEAKPKDHVFRHDFNVPIDAGSLYNMLRRSLPSYTPEISISRPINYTRLAVNITLALGAITLIAMLRPYLVPVIQNRHVWAVASLVAVLLFISGQMFTQIRKMPYIAANDHGGIMYFAPGFQAQIGIEGQIIAALYAILSASAIVLAVKAPRIQEPKIQHVVIVGSGVLMFGTYSYLLSVFRSKNSGYPFYLPPFT